MTVQIIQVPYDSGNRSLRMGRRPEHFIQNGIEQVLRDCGYEVYVDCIATPSAFHAEIKTAFELHELLAKRIRATHEAGIGSIQPPNGHCPLLLGHADRVQ